MCRVWTVCILYYIKVSVVGKENNSDYKDYLFIIYQKE